MRSRLAISFFVNITFGTNIATIISAINIKSLIRLGGRRVTTTAFLPPQHSCARQAVGFDTRTTRSHYFSIHKRASFVSSATISCNINKHQSGNSNMEKSASNTTQDEATILLLRQRKQSLRKQIRFRIKSSYPPTETDKLTIQSNQVFSHLFTLPQYQSAKSIGFFLSMPSGEIQTRNAIRQIVKEGKILFVPRVGLDFEKCDMDLVRCDTTAGGADGELFYDSWPRNKWGIPEPPVATSSNDEAKPGDIDLLIVPGLAFDTYGHRLGQGKGYYDRFIAKMRDDDEAKDGRNERKPILVGVCLEEQFLYEVPHGVDLGDSNDGSGGIIPVSDHDYIMDMVLTPSRTLTVPKHK